MGIVDLLLIAVVGIVAWSVASEGPWGAAFTLLAVVFAGLLAMNFFEPLAELLERSISASPSWAPRWDVIALVGLFALFALLLRLMTDYVAPRFMPVHPLVHEGGRWGFGVLTGYATMAILLTALHTAPLPREFMGFRPERNNLLGLAAPDRQWLGFTQHVSEKVFTNGRIFDGPQFTVGRVANRVWPSFPIRYASRREALEKSATAATTVIHQRRKNDTSRPQKAGRRGF